MTDSEIRDFLQQAIEENRVMLFMKGTPEAPACGFSARTAGALNALGVRYAALDILPPRYRQGQLASAAPMGAAPLRYTAEGQVAWDQMWTGFCDLALAGGPRHRDTVLEPPTA